MEQKIIFREMLSEIKKLADTKENRLTQQEVKDFFANAHLNGEQFEMIYEYLRSQRIRVEGWQGGSGEAVEGSNSDRSEQKTDKRNQEDGEWEKTEENVKPENRETWAGIAQYLEEIGEAAELEPEEELALFQRAVDGAAEAKSRLVELYLPMVCSLAGELEEEESLIEDLIQEGNVGLLLAVDGLEHMDSLAAYQAKLMNEVNRCMQEALQEQRDVREMGKDIEKQVNHLNDAIRELEEDLEHRVSLEELSAYLEMPVEEIKGILKMAGDELKVDGYEK